MSKTYAEQFEGAIAQETPEQARAWFDAEVASHAERWGTTPEKAAETIRANLGYMAGYYDHETAQKVHRLYGAVHPIFGTADYYQTVSPEQAFEVGKRLGEGAS